MASHLVLLLAVLAVAAAAPQAGSAAASKRAHFERVVCGDLTPEQCKAKGGACHPGRYMLQIKDSTALSNCASKNGITLRERDDPVEAINEILRMSGVSPTAFKATRDCFYTHLGLISNGSTDLEAINTMLLTNVEETITDPREKAAILGALNRCPLPVDESMTKYGVCLARTCIAILAKV